MQDERRRDHAAPDRTLADTEAALDETLVELEAVLRLARAELSAASQTATPEVVRRASADLERSLRAAADRVRRLGDATMLETVRGAGREAELMLREAGDRLVRAGQVGTPGHARVAARETDGYVRRAVRVLRRASDSTRPHLIRQAARIDRAMNRGQRRLFRILWFTVPPGSLVFDVHFQALIVSRFLTDMALQALLYGTLIAVVLRGGTPFDAALVGTAYLLPGVLLGLYGGAVADALPKRVALAGAYVAMGLLCFAVPLFMGTGFPSLLAIIFAVRVLHQVSQPSEASAVPLVADAEELASANSFMSLGSSVGEVVGKAALAPLLVHRFGVQPVVTFAGVLFILAFTRVFELAPPRERPVRLRPVRLGADTTVALRWLVGERRVLWMLLLAGLASTVGVVLGMLGPAYVHEVLHIDPTLTLYVFMPAALGLVAALAAAPKLIALFGERVVAAVGFVLASVAMVGLGAVQPLTQYLLPWLVEDWPGITHELEVAALLSIPLGAGITLAAAATQTFVGRAVPPALQGRVFAVMGMLKDGLAILPLLVLGAAARMVGARGVIGAAPFVLLALALGIDFVAGRFRSPPAEDGDDEATLPASA